MGENQGKIIMEPGLNIWPHELKTAEALAGDGHIVEFIRKSEVDYERTPDVLIDGVPFEMKAPKSSHLSVVDKNLKKALSQSRNIVFDSKRMGGAMDAKILNELEKSLSARRKIKSLIFVDKNRDARRLK